MQAPAPQYAGAVGGQLNLAGLVLHHVKHRRGGHVIGAVQLGCESGAQTRRTRGDEEAVGWRRVCPGRPRRRHGDCARRAHDSSGGGGGGEGELASGPNEASPAEKAP